MDIHKIAKEAGIDLGCGEFLISSQSLIALADRIRQQQIRKDAEICAAMQMNADGDEWREGWNAGSTQAGLNIVKQLKASIVGREERESPLAALAASEAS
ncbi:hypothetical protein [Chromobacterium sp. IIBBL 290-4]|uniref:hypothetical protein n=1 Tax=Chromobacterium sp. IIBBL 290-4 TaxID=2953890 RepID=UPI0020B7D509|nr:hypothetical protein [Chromobacterium sp. IIBBL 290-4]UTH73851.1 hypothetical protein NKT35_20260 [Chromobacterium sp. IIBBL 290-4]